MSRNGFEKAKLLDMMHLILPEKERVAFFSTVILLTSSELKNFFSMKTNASQDFVYLLGTQIKLQ